jgi:hypothetical protein
MKTTGTLALFKQLLKQPNFTGPLYNALMHPTVYHGMKRLDILRIHSLLVRNFLCSRFHYVLNLAII